MLLLRITAEDIALMDYAFEARMAARIIEPLPASDD
jgi:hypothetical protein